MDPIICTICKKTNHLPQSEGLIVATFSTNFAAKEALFAVEKSHILPVWCKIFSKEEIFKKTNGSLMESETLFLQLHGLKDIVNLEMLYVESICREKNALTVDIFSTQKSSEKILQQLQ